MKVNVLAFLTSTAIFLSDLHFIPGHREVQMVFLLLIFAHAYYLERASIPIPRSLAEKLFFALLFYLIANCVFSSYVNGVSGHWVLYFAMFIPLMGTFRNAAKWDLSEKLDLILSINASLLSYLALGIFLKFLPGLPSFVTSTALLVPITIVLPFIFFGIRYGNLRMRRISFISAVGCFVLIIIESSRSALGLFIVSLFLGVRATGGIRQFTRQSMRYLPVALIASAPLAALTPIGTIFMDTLLIFGGRVETGALKDIDRFLNYAAAFDFLSNSNLFTISFGTGFRSSWLYAGPILTDYYDALLPDLDYSKDQTIIGLPNIIVSVGIFGSALVLAAVVSSAFYLREFLPGPWWNFLAFSMMSVLLRTVGNDITGNVLFFMAVMPWGLYFFLAQTIKDLEGTRASVGVA